jgi:hypothetical protein
MGMGLRYESCIFWDSQSHPPERWTYRLARVDLQSEVNLARDRLSIQMVKGQERSILPS